MSWVWIVVLIAFLFVAYGGEHLLTHRGTREDPIDREERQREHRRKVQSWIDSGELKDLGATNERIEAVQKMLNEADDEEQEVQEPTDSTGWPVGLIKPLRLWERPKRDE